MTDARRRLDRTSREHGATRRCPKKKAMAVTRPVGIHLARRPAHHLNGWNTQLSKQVALTGDPSCETWAFIRVP